MKKSKSIVENFYKLRLQKSATIANKRDPVSLTNSKFGILSLVVPILMSLGETSDDKS